MKVKVKDYEPYEYLNDNGFFNNDYQVDNGFFNNDYQVETVVVPVENKNEVSFCEKAALSNTAKSDNGKLDTFLYRIWKFSDFEIGFKLTILSLLFIPLYSQAFKEGKNDIGILGIIAQLLVIGVGVFVMAGDYITSSIYAKSKGLHFGQTLYTLNYNYDIIPVNLYNITWNDEKEVFPVFHCTIVKDKKNDRDRYISFKADELFLTPEQAAQYISIIHSKHIEALNDMLNDKAEAFLSGPLFQKYSVLYYEKRNICTWYPTQDHLSFNDFLMSKQSLISFCNFIKATKAKEETAIQKQAAQDKEENSLISDILNSVQKDMMDSI